MLRTLRPYATAAIAIAGTAAVVAGPALVVYPPPPDIRVAAPVVQPATTVAQLFQNTAANLGVLGPELASDPLPVLTQILENNIDSASAILPPTVDIVVGTAGYVLRLPVTAVEAIQALFAPDGGIGPAIEVLVQPLIPLAVDGVDLFNAVIPALQQPFQNIANAIGTLTVPNLGLLGLGLVSPLIATVVATVDAVTAVVDAASGEEASVGNTVKALVDVIPTIVNGFLNGTAVLDRTIDLPFPYPDVVINGGAGGLLSTGSFSLDIGWRNVTVGIDTSGPIAAVHNYLKVVAAATRSP